MTTLDDAIRRVHEATSDEELFGPDDPHRGYLRLAAVLHPDRVAPGARAAATDAFVTLTNRWRARGTVVFGRYRVGAVAHTGDLANLHDLGRGLLLKQPRRPVNNDLMEREATALRRIADAGDPRYLPYVPRMVDTFRHRDPGTGQERRVNVLGSVPHLTSLADVMRLRPEGLDPRDAAWIWRRLLVALGLAHRAGVVHGAVLPEHILIETTDHGVVLVDWCYSVVDGLDHVPAVVERYADWYPPEVHNRLPPEPGTDIAMAARSMTALMGGHAPAALLSFADGCTLPSPRSRPDDAWALLAELDDLLERLYGVRKFRPLNL
ncbi:serine/threonine protein kinase [Asanoa sp. WMMD1127]|uniref:serine/threonine protein kinase n=1 Tax=Asanoa sp. WMMD1127 TaxID=3016107 RepID=UPI002417E761|nr:serine/threonine protein kinase [Asanoa sp. WMMD1127]MDG4821953.1 serine/threonine protein kinase [Asanoa sp. WMMD1127]